FFIAKTLQQRFKLIKSLLLISSDCFENDTCAEIQIRSKHFQQAGRREILLASPNSDCALEPDQPPEKQRRRSRVQAELVDNFDFFAHAVQRGDSRQTCRATYSGQSSLLSRKVTRSLSADLHKRPVEPIAPVRK